MRISRWSKSSALSFIRNYLSRESVLVEKYGTHLVFCELLFPKNVSIGFFVKIIWLFSNNCKNVAAFLVFSVRGCLLQHSQHTLCWSATHEWVKVDGQRSSEMSNNNRLDRIEWNNVSVETQQMTKKKNWEFSLMQNAKQPKTERPEVTRHPNRQRSSHPNRCRPRAYSSAHSASRGSDSRYAPFLHLLSSEPKWPPYPLSSIPTFSSPKTNATVPTHQTAHNTPWEHPTWPIAHLFRSHVWRLLFSSVGGHSWYLPTIPCG